MNVSKDYVIIKFMAKVVSMTTVDMVEMRGVANSAKELYNFYVY